MEPAEAPGLLLYKVVSHQDYARCYSLAVAYNGSVQGDPDGLFCLEDAFLGGAMGDYYLCPHDDMACHAKSVRQITAYAIPVDRVLVGIWGARRSSGPQRARSATR
jgi:hypothetical protein